MIPFTSGPPEPMEVIVTPLVVLAAWSVLSVPAAFAVGAVLSVVGRRTVPVPVSIPVTARR